MLWSGNVFLVLVWLRILFNYKNQFGLVLPLLVLFISALLFGVSFWTAFNSIDLWIGANSTALLVSCIISGSAYIERAMFELVEKRRAKGLRNLAQISF